MICQKIANGHWKLWAPTVGIAACNWAVGWKFLGEIHKHEAPWFPGGCDFACALPVLRQGHGTHTVVLLDYFSFAMFIEIPAVALWLFSPLLLWRDLEGIEPCVLGNTQWMSLQGALRPNELAEHCFPNGFFCGRLHYRKKKYVGVSFGMAEGWETLMHDKTWGVCHTRKVLGHNYFKTVMVELQGCVVLN